MAQKIQIIVDNPFRDLQADVLLAAQLAERGFNAILTPFDNAPYESFRFCPDYLLANYCRVTNEAFLKRLMTANIHFGILDTEGGVFVKLEELGGKPNFVGTLTQNKNIISKVEDYFTWGPEIFEFMKQEWPEASGAMQLMGTPRTDVFHSRWNLPNKKKDIILLNTSFTLVNTKFRPVEDEIDDLVNRFGYSRSKIEAEAKGQLQVAADFVSSAKV